MQPEEYEKLDDKEKVGAEKPEGTGDPKFDSKAENARAEGERLAQKIGESGGLPSGDNSGGNLQGKVSGLLRARRTYIIGVAAGGLMAALLGFFFAFLAPFKLSFMKENVDSKRMARLLYILDQRSDRFLVTMMKAEIAGERDGKNRYFEAKGWYDSPNSFTQWYKDIRTDKFFDDMAKNQGIRFARETSGVGQDRLVRLTAVDVNGQRFDFSDLRLDGGTTGNTVDFERLVEERFETNRSARRAFNTALKDQTKSWQVVKRYNMRKWGYERLGITKWRFFENTREKAENAVKDRWTRTVSRPILTGRFGRCIFGTPDDCPRTSNPNDERNSFGNDSPDPNLERNLDESVDEVRNGDAPNGDGPDGAERRVAGKIASKFAGKAVPVLNAAQTADTIEQIDYLLADEDGKRGLVKLVATMRAAEYASTYFAFGTVTDHLKEGKDVSAEEVNSFMKMTDGIEKSDSYQQIVAKSQPNPFSTKAYAQSSNSKDEIPYDEVTDEMKVGSEGNNAQKLTKYYSSTFGPVTGVIADAVGGVKDLPIIGDAYKAIMSTLNSALGVLTSAATWAFGAITGVNVEEVMQSFVSKMYEFLGGAPICGAEEGGPRLLNCTDAGGSVVAESLTQTMGGGPLSEKQVMKMEQDAALAKYEEDKLKSPIHKIASLEDPNSMFGKLVLSTPSSYTDAFEKSGDVIASIMPQKLGNLIANGPSLISRISNTSYADVNDKNLYGVKPYGPSEADLDKEPFGSLSEAECEKEIEKFNEAMKKGEDPPTSMCLIDQGVGNSLACMYSDDESCASVTTESTQEGQESCSEGDLKLSKVASDHGAHSIVVRRVGGKLLGEHNGNKSPNAPASMLKLIIVDAVLSSGVDLDKRITVTSDLIYSGGNSSDGLTVGGSITLREAITKALSLSSNTHANVIIKAGGGIGTVNQKIQDLGYKNTTLRNYYRDGTAGVGNQSTAIDITKAMNKIFSSDDSGFSTAQSALRQSSQISEHFGLNSEANKWGKRSEPPVTGNSGVFKIGNSKYIITVYVNQANADSAIQDTTKDVIEKIKGGAGQESTVSEDCPSGDLVDLAKQVLENNKVSFGTNSGGNARDVIVAVSKGEQAYTTSSDAYAVAHRKVDLNPNILKFILEVAKTHSIKINATTDADHGATSNHYKGIAVDLNCSPQIPGSVLDKAAQKFKGADNGERCDTGTDHWHYDFK